MFFSFKLKSLVIWTAVFFVIIFCVSFGSICVFREGKEEGAELYILMYHHILKDPKMHGDYVISPDEFEADLKYLNKEGYETVNIGDLINYTYNGVPLPEKAVMLTFDDGYLSNLEYAYPLLKKYNMKAVISVIGKLSEDYAKTEDRHIPYAHITWDDIIKMTEEGVFEVQNHTYNMHKSKRGERFGAKRVSGETPEAYKEEFMRDVGLCQELLEKNCKITPLCFTYPFGMISDESVEFVKEMGFLASLSCREGANYISDDTESLYLLKRYNRRHLRSAEKILGK